MRKRSDVRTRAKRRWLASVAVMFTLALAVTATDASADGGGNGASGTIGAVQVGPVSAEPAASVATQAAAAAAQAPAAVTGSGGNQAKNSVGTAQAGGPNSASNSTGSASASGARAAPAATAAAAGRSASASSTNTVNGTTRSTGIAPPAAPARSRVGAPASPAGVQPSSQTISFASSGAPFDAAFTATVEQLALEAQVLGISPDVLLLFDPFAQLMLGGTIGAGPNGGNTSDQSLGTVQLGSFAVDPTLVLLPPALGTSVDVAGGSGIDGTGLNSVSGSTGAAQAGGGNGADGSTGTAQIGGFTVAPTLAASTPLGNADLGGASGVDGGQNSATGSAGVVQIGGGNTVDDSTGAAQAGGVTVGPTLALTGTPAGDASLGGSSGVAGGGNDASGSTGTLQVGGGNSADGSTGTAQTGPVDVGPTVGSDGTGLGGGGPEDTTGTATVSAAAEAAAQTPGTAASANAAAAANRQRGSADRPAGQRGVEGTASPRNRGGSTALQYLTMRRGSLPFTGLGLALYVALGLALLLTGSRLRSYAEG
jgi:hypothetical protein